jgi:MerR, DNA binding
LHAKCSFAISFGRASGLTLREIRELFGSGRRYSRRMRETARRRLVEIDALIEPEWRA